MLPNMQRAGWDRSAMVRETVNGKDVIAEMVDCHAGLTIDLKLGDLLVSPMIIKYPNGLPPVLLFTVYKLTKGDNELLTNVIVSNEKVMKTFRDVNGDSLKIGFPEIGNKIFVSFNKNTGFSVHHQGGINVAHDDFLEKVKEVFGYQEKVLGYAPAWDDED